MTAPCTHPDWEWNGRANVCTTPTCRAVLEPTREYLATTLALGSALPVASVPGPHGLPVVPAKRSDRVQGAPMAEDLTTGSVLRSGQEGEFVHGRKYDTGKLDWTLLPWDALEPVVRVLAYGAQKYGERDNWRKVDGAYARYRAAAMRHLVADMNGEERDPETGEDPLAHAVCSLLFAIAHGRGA